MKFYFYFSKNKLINRYISILIGRLIVLVYLSFKCGIVWRRRRRHCAVWIYTNSWNCWIFYLLLLLLLLLLFWIIIINPNWNVIIVYGTVINRQKIIINDRFPLKHFSFEMLTKSKANTLKFQPFRVWLLYCVFFYVHAMHILLAKHRRNKQQIDQHRVLLQVQLLRRSLFFLSNK